MAAIVWDGDTSTDPENGANWVGGVKPGGSDIGTFSDQGNGNCQMTAGISWAGINVTADYSGEIDFNDQAITTSGDQTYAGTGEVKCGTGTITCDGNFDNKDQGTWTRETSTLVLSGAIKTVRSEFVNSFNNLTVSGSYTMAAAMDVGTLLRVSGSLAVDALLQITTGEIDISGGTLSGTSTIRLWAGTCTITNVAGVWSVANTATWNNILLGAGTYGGTWFSDQRSANNYTFRFLGNVIFTGDVEFKSDETANTFTIDAATNDVDIEFQGDLNLNETEAGSTLFWDKAATGTVTFAGTGTQTYTDSTAAIQDLGDVEHDGAGGTLQLATEMECDDYAGTAGTLNCATFDIDCGGNFAAAASYTVTADNPGDGTITIAGTFDLNGGSGTEVTWTNVDLDITGAATAHWTDVTDSDASAGVDVDASDNCSDTGANPGWNFGVAVTAAKHYIIGGGILGI